jgi:hypothetical protein
MQIPFVGAAYVDASLSYDCQRCVNFYPEYSEAVDPKTGASSSKNINKLSGTPGALLQYQTVNSTQYGVRALHVCQIQNVLVAVYGNLVFKIAADGTITQCTGTIGSTSGPLSIADNGFQCVIADGGGYYFNITDASPALVNLNISAIKVLFNDTYLIFITPDSPVFFLSGNDNVTLNALDYASIQDYPQNLTLAEIVNGYLVLGGTQSAEVWQNSGNVLFPYSRVAGVSIEQGCANIFAEAKVENYFCWLGSTERGGYVVYKSNGFGYERISNHAIEEQIQSYGEAGVAAAFAFSFEQRGHYFFALSFPLNGATWVWDGTMSGGSVNLWHERIYWNAATAQEQCWIASCHAFFNGQNLVGDIGSGNIYLLDYNTFTDNGNAIKRIRTSPHYAELDDYQNIAWHRMTFDMQVGNVPQDGQGSSPTMELDFSDNGGLTYGFSRVIDLNQVGNYRSRIMVRRIGMSRNRVFRLTITDPIDVEIYGCSTRETIAAH